MPKLSKSLRTSNRGGGEKFFGKNRVFLANEQKILQAQVRSCITDSLSHSICVETNEP